MPNDPAIPPQPTSVEKARNDVQRWELVNERVNAEIRRYFERNLDALIASVRAEERERMVYEWTARLEREHRAAALREVRALVEGEIKHWDAALGRVLAGLAKLEGQ